MMGKRMGRNRFLADFFLPKTAERRGRTVFLLKPCLTISGTSRSSMIKEVARRVRTSFALKTGGNTWKERLSARPLKINDFFMELQGISFADQSIGWTVGESGQIMKTEDAGKTWTMATKRDECGRNTFFLNKKTGWIYGPYGDQDHFKHSTYICRTDDGGLTREIQNVGIEVGDVFFVDNSNGWAVGWLKEAQGVQNPGGGCPCPGKVWNVVKHTGDGGKRGKLNSRRL